MDYSFIADTAAHFGAEILFDEHLAKYTSFNIGGKCDVMVKPGSAECIREIISLCRKENIKYYVFGRCSNVLISDKGLKGVVILIGGDFSEIRRDGDMLVCDAGVSLSKLCVAAKEMELTGLEFAYGIPGTVGGGLYMNAGAYGGEMKDVVLWCEYLDEDGSIKRMNAEEMELSYRHSVFSGKDNVILTVCIGLSKGNKQEISEKMSELMQKRKDKQPLEYPSAGSTFKRPEGYFAAKLIEDCGLKGYTRGGAQVSEKHSGFVINKGGASFDDVIGIMEDIKTRVFNETGVKLEREVLVIE